MFISVSFSPLKEHISMLEQEKNAVHGLRRSLESIYRQAIDFFPETAELYQQQVAFADAELIRIQKRKELLEQTLDVFADAKNEYESKLSEARSLLRKNI